jgi:hypothetical protein
MRCMTQNKDIINIREEIFPIEETTWFAGLPHPHIWVSKGASKSSIPKNCSEMITPSSTRAL